MLFKVFTKLGDIAISEKGKKPIILINEKKSGYIPYINIEAFEKKVFNKYTDGYGCRLCDEGDVLIVWDGSRSGLVGRAYKGAIGSTIAKIQIPYIKNDYLYYFLIGKYLILNTRTKGTGTPHVDPAILWNFDFPIISNVEQTRIVEKIEELFSDLDKATEDLKKTQEQLKIYRQAVLKAAFEGKLTETWRVQNSIELLFEEVLLKDITDIIMGQSPPSSTYNTNKVGLPFYQGKKEFGDLFPTPEKYCSEPKKIAESNDILISVRAPVGPTNICKEKSCIGRGLAAIRTKEKIEKYYLFYYLKYFVFDLIEKSTGTTFNAISKDTLESFKVSLFSLQEQQQIIKEIESRLSVCDKLEETIEQSLKKIEYLRQSILKKAFEGKLVPQDPNDPPAGELLKQIKIEKDKMSKNGK
ncbi:MAG: restriction endonuclease subunit S [Actinobacteria bacterium]|nr:restriction endonuclease subunit S [Actinomycetota bacterium]